MFSEIMASDLWWPCIVTVWCTGHVVLVGLADGLYSLVTFFMWSRQPISLTIPSFWLWIPAEIWRFHGSSHIRPGYDCCECCIPIKDRLSNSHPVCSSKARFLVDSRSARGASSGLSQSSTSAASSFGQNVSISSLSCLMTPCECRGVSFCSEVVQSLHLGLMYMGSKTQICNELCCRGFEELVRET